MIIYLLFWSFVAYGMTTIIVYGEIFEKLRMWFQRNIPFIGRMVQCPLCTSTWVGFFMSVVLGGLTQTIFSLTGIDGRILGVFFDGMYTAGTVWAINSIIEFFEEFNERE